MRRLAAVLLIVLAACGGSADAKSTPSGCKPGDRKTSYDSTTDADEQANACGWTNYAP
jgi:ABC-type glycerol-3-phosphate transport system substrate-binding protein